LLFVWNWKIWNLFFIAVNRRNEEYRFAQSHGVESASNHEIVSTKDMVKSMLRNMRCLLSST
jgi:hypothetical protein